MTLAFSTKSGQWTTEYSFEPTCYANTDGRMIAFKDVTDGSFWLHDEKESDRNKYYGTSYKSRMSVVSNEDPSATKSYEAISLETSSDSWKIDVATLEQEGVVQNLYQRENDQYAPIPKDVNVSAANLVYIGTTSGSDFFSSVDNGEIQLSSMSGNIATGVLCYVNNSNKIQSFRSNGFGNDVPNFNGTVVKAVGFSEKSKSISLDVSELSSPATDLTGVPDDVQLFVADEDSGESMKGDYLVINIETQSTVPSNFELYAINVDQHKVNLDHSLGQNN